MYLMAILFSDLKKFSFSLSGKEKKEKSDCQQKSGDFIYKKCLFETKNGKGNTKKVFLEGQVRGGMFKLKISN